MPKKCHVCGIVHRKTIRCRICKEHVCIFCLNLNNYYCHDCYPPIEYKERYERYFSKYRKDVSA